MTEYTDALVMPLCRELAGHKMVSAITALHPHLIALLAKLDLNTSGLRQRFEVEIAMKELFIPLRAEVFTSTFGSIPPERWDIVWYPSLEELHVMVDIYTDLKPHTLDHHPIVNILGDPVGPKCWHTRGLLKRESASVKFSKYGNTIVDWREGGA